jgi:N-acetyl sugar amidotransferase
MQTDMLKSCGMIPPKWKWYKSGLWCPHCGKKLMVREKEKGDFIVWIYTCLCGYEWAMPCEDVSLKTVEKLYGRSYGICTRCIMDISDSFIQFDRGGVCNHCRLYDILVKQRVLKGSESEQAINAIREKIKKDGEGKRYDCIMGLSGGVDSTYVAYLVKQWGLRPLAVSLDNGYDTEIASANVKNLVKKLNLDHKVYTVDWGQFKDLQLAYLKSGVLDLETPTDNVLTAMLYRYAKNYNVKYLITGYNIATEGIMPSSWNFADDDILNLKAIHKVFGTKPINLLPTIGLYQKLYYEYGLGIKQVTVLNMIPYAKSEAKELIKKELGWVDYGAKHHESIYTRFFQVYILPKRWGIDKRRAHLSSLVCAGQMTRNEALKEIVNSPYPNPQMEQQDKEFVLNKLGITDERFEAFMALPKRSHLEFSSDYRARQIMRFVYQVLARRAKGQ